MKALVMLAALVFVPIARGEDLPNPQSFAAYETMAQRSPFARATFKSAESSDCVKDLYVASIDWMRDQTVVTLGSTKARNVLIKFSVPKR